MKLYSKFKEEIYLQKSSAKCQSFCPGFNDSGWALWITCERARTFSLTHYEFHADCHVHIFWFQESNSRSLFYWHGLTLISTWISNYMHYKVWDEIAYQFRNEWVMLLHILQGMWLLIHAEIQVNARRQMPLLSVILVYVMAWLISIEPVVTLVNHSDVTWASCSFKSLGVRLFYSAVSSG